MLVFFNCFSFPTTNYSLYNSQKNNKYHHYVYPRAVNPSRPQILRIDGEWVIDDVIMQGTWRHFLEGKKARKRCCFNCNIWPNWFTSHQSHYCLYYNGIPEFVRKCSILTEKKLKQCKIFEISLSESQIYKKWQLRRLSGRFQTLIWRLGETV